MIDPGTKGTELQRAIVSPWAKYRLAVLLVMVVALTFAVRQCQRETAARKTVESTANRGSVIAGVESGREAVAKREQGYRATDSATNNIDKIRERLRRQEAALVLPDREGLHHAAKQMDGDAIARSFILDGYSCAVKR